jgi:hypothetical protein
VASTLTAVDAEEEGPAFLIDGTLPVTHDWRDGKMWKEEMRKLEEY